MNAFDEEEKESESRDDYMRQKEEMQKEYGRIFRSLCSGDCEILENDDYIACMIRTAQCLEEENDREYRWQAFETVSELPQSYRTPLTQLFLEVQSEPDQDAQKRLQEIFRVQQEEIFLQNDSSISSAFLQPGMLPHWHKNDYFDIIYVMEGESQCFFRQEKLELVEGDVLIVPPDIEHGEGVRDLDGRTMTSAIRKRTFLEIFFRVFSGNPLLYSFFQRIFRGEEEISYILFHTAEKDKPDMTVARLFDHLWEEQKCKEKYHSEMCETIMNAIFVYLLRYYEQNLVLPQDCKANWKKEYAKIFWYISENYRSVTLEELEDRFHYSRRQLIRIVQNATGKNFKDVIRDMKMERAKMLLRDTTLPVERIAMECGYENASSFTRIFKQTVGVSPRAYRHGIFVTLPQ